MEVIPKSKLHQFAAESMRRADMEIIENIIRSVYYQVIHRANHAKGTSLLWNYTIDYVLGDCESIRVIHLVKACVRLQELFPDSQISRTSQEEILVDWS